MFERQRRNLQMLNIVQDCVTQDVKRPERVIFGYLTSLPTNVTRDVAKHEGVNCR